MSGQSPRTDTGADGPGSGACGVGAFGRKYRCGLFVLLGLVLVAYGRSAVVPSLLGDEWGHLSSYLNGNAACPSWSLDRPFDFCWYSLLFGVSGVNVHFHHIGAILLLLTCAVLLLAGLEVWTGHRALNIAIASLWAVYPTVLARNWPTGQLTSAIAALLGAMLLGLLFWRNGKWFYWMASLLLFVLAIGIYEAVIGVVCVFSLGLFLWGVQRPLLQRLGLLAPVGLSAVAVLRLLAVGPRYGAGALMVAPDVLLWRLVFGLRVELLGGWGQAVRHWLPGIALDARYATGSLAVLLGAVTLACMALANRIASRRRIGTRTSEKCDSTLRWNLARPMLIIAAVGLALMIAGFFPFVLAFFPGNDFEASRSHYVPSIGAAVFVGGLVLGVAALLAEHRVEVTGLAIAGIVPLVMVGLVQQVLVQGKIAEAWSAQKSIWRQLFESAPDIREGTQVVFLVDGYASEWGPAPFISGPTGVSAALGLLYGKSSVRGAFAYGGAASVLSLEGTDLVVDDSYHEVRRFPVESVIVVVYDKRSDRLERIGALSSGSERIGLATEKPVESVAPNTTPTYRQLVQ